MQTARKTEFRSRLHQGDHLLLIADEVHQIGSPDNSQLLQTHVGPRMGLSATPTRFGDPDGTARLFDYFGPIIEPVVTLQDAIASGRLVPYEYHPHPVQLTASESENWKQLTTLIIREVARGPKDRDGQPLVADRVKLLLIQRARIAKKAVNKVALASNVLRAAFQADQRWLVYCEDLEQLSAVLAALRRIGLQAAEYYSEMQGDKTATLEWLQRFGGIVVSIRCLDEGVDIPEVSHALILASSQNPRQFIQRRGRVLRKAPDKYMAVIHDAVVVPPSAELEPEQLALARAELARALEFCMSAINKNGSEEIADIASQLGISFDVLTASGVEEADELPES
jgi:superfamily II DNA or RNA helicase